ncbi:hypothetical protein DET57_109164 [Klebsiella oxytoca]|uniref:Inner membrane protein CbrB n=1 Tax=Klebsiella oxytoca TaxID=571 RepID=A0A318FLS6_KLEOX|nr:hypothetical protein [Klebsiella oxytoca]PXW44480.1 hypothetical protein DET57_109164 [Klebsiella oxytoca]HCB1500925.1 hypothetical protein [Klebsiella michiganensis]HCB1847291.1 hypothetical protein [Klebsiella oxytoca]
MNKFLHHICWYVGLGPFIPLPLILFFPGGGSITRLLEQLPEILSLTWIVAFLPTLLTGIFMAILSGQVYRIWFWRLLTGGITAVVITAICGGIIGAFIPMLFYVLPLLIVSALLSGMVMGLIIPWLPPRVAPRQ